MKNFILCIDGEQWTEKAITYAIEITRAFNGKLTALHVISPYLKKFADEIYAVGRFEYSDHIDKELRKDAEHIVTEFKAIADSTGIPYRVIIRYGLPEEEIIQEILDNTYDLLILGVQPLTTLRRKIGSFNLPLKIFNSIRIPSVFVR